MTQKRTNSAIKVHNSVKLDDKTPVPLDFDSSAFVSLGGFRYIPFFAPDDDQFKKLLILRLLSNTQGSCINDKTLYAAGEGLNILDAEFPAAFNKKINGKRQTIDTVLKLGFDAYWQDGNVFFEIVRTTVGTGKYVHVYVHNNLDCRLEENEDGDPTHVLRTKEFRRSGILTKMEKAVRIPLWTDMAISDAQVWARDADNKNVERTMIHVKNEMGAIDGYGLPSNFHGLMQVGLEYKAARFNLDNFDNNMFLGGVLMIQGSLSTEEEKKLTKNLRKMYTGDGTYNRILPLSAEGGITDTKFVPFNDKHDGHFTELDKRVEEKIIGANSWSKELMDLKNQSGLGKGGDYLRTLFKAKYKTVIKPAQDLFMFNLIEPLMSIIDEWQGTDFAQMPWYIKPSIPVAFEGDLDINSLLTVDEGREEIGKKPFEDERGKKMIKEVGSKQMQLDFKEGGKE